MRIINKLWIGVFIIIVLWIYFLFISPLIFNSGVVVVPDLVGMNEEEAVDKLKKSNIDYQITYIQNSSESVLKTIPYAGVNIKKNFIIDLYIGKIFPNSYHSYLGLLYDDVKEEIERICNDNAIKLEIKYVEDNSLISGVIINESFVDGYIMKKGDILTLTISNNNSYFVMPNLVGLNIYDALAILKEYDIKAIVNYYSSPIENDIVLIEQFAYAAVKTIEETKV